MSAALVLVLEVVCDRPAQPSKSLVSWFAPNPHDHDCMPAPSGQKKGLYRARLDLPDPSGPATSSQMRHGILHVGEGIGMRYV